MHKSSETKQGGEGATKRHCSIAGTTERNNDNISSDINETLLLLFTSQVTVSRMQGGEEGATKRRCSIAGTVERNNDSVSSDINETLPLLFTSQVMVSGMQGLGARLVCKINLNLNMKIIIVMLHGCHRNWGVLLCEMNSPGVRLVFNLLF